MQSKSGETVASLPPSALGVQGFRVLRKRGFMNEKPCLGFRGLGLWGLSCFVEDLGAWGFWVSAGFSV